MNYRNILIKKLVQLKMIELRDKNGNLRFTIYDLKEHSYPSCYWVTKEYPPTDAGEAVGLTADQFIELLEKYWKEDF